MAEVAAGEDEESGEGGDEDKSYLKAEVSGVDV